MVDAGNSGLLQRAGLSTGLQARVNSSVRSSLQGSSSRFSRGIGQGCSERGDTVCGLEELGKSSSTQAAKDWTLLLHQCQAGATPELRHFGADLILGGLDNCGADLSPLVPPDYVVAPGDEVSLTRKTGVRKPFPT